MQGDYFSGFENTSDKATELTTFLPRRLLISLSLIISRPPSLNCPSCKWSARDSENDCWVKIRFGLIICKRSSLGCWIDLHSMMKLWKHDNEAKIGQQVIKRFQNAESFVRLWPMQDNPGKQFSRICRGFLWGWSSINIYLGMSFASLETSTCDKSNLCTAVSRSAHCLSKLGQIAH